MNILYCGDARIQRGVLMSALSLADHVDEPLDIYLLTFGWPGSDGAPALRPLAPFFARGLEEQLAKGNSANTVHLIDATNLFAAAPPLANLDTRFTPGCMLRLYADLVPAIPDRVLYLDNDVLCRGDVRGLWETELGDAEIAGVLDYYGSWVFKREGVRRNYLNSGVLVMDMGSIRRGGLFEECRTLCATQRMFMPDQTALNKRAKKKVLPRRYNEQRILRPDTVMQHFTTSFRVFPWFRLVNVKPWDIERMHGELGLHEYDELFERFKRLEPQVCCP